MKSFVFISYCHKNKKVFNRVQKLVLYLRNRNIPVVYDEGGLPAGTELTQFENLILNKNCKYVLIVCDKWYIRKAENEEGGVWREFFNISNDYPKNRKKYVPLIVNAKLPIFEGKVYIDFSNDEEEKWSEIEELIAPIKAKVTGTEREVEALAKMADQLFDSENYDAAKQRIDEGIKIYENQKRPQKAYRARLYNIKLYICIQNGDMENAIETANKLRETITTKIEYEKRTVYFCNCALAYRMGKDAKKYEECAKESYQMALKCGNEEMDHYACLYATALYETQQFTEAYNIIKEAQKYFLKKHEDLGKCNEEDKIKLIKIKGNVAEIAIAFAENSKKSRKEKIKLLLEAQSCIMDVINISKSIDAAAIQYEVCSIVVLVYEALKRYYLVEMS